MENAPQQPGLADRLQRVVASMRADLDVSRHVFHDGPAYVLRDPTSFGSFRLTPSEYLCLTALDDRRPLGATFEALVESGDLEAENEEEFYGLVVEAHRSGLLSLPINDASSLHQRHERRRRARARSLLFAFVSLKIPLIDPSSFLDATVSLARPLFTRWAFGAWLALMSAAAYLVVVRWEDLVRPVTSMTFLENLPLLWLVLIGLKVVHEFGHAYACRVFGGHVPEMGVLLILLTPCAYVDATDSWRFPSRWPRLVVGLAGMYVESIVGVIALYVWAMTSTGLANTIAYQVLVMSTIVTIGFNLNPLARFDGYYILGDLVNVPNLRSRSRAELVALFERFALGLRRSKRDLNRHTRALFVVFGVSSIVYRTLLTLTICALIATKFYLVGLGLAIGYLGLTIGGLAARTFRSIWTLDAPPMVRARGAIVGILLAGATLLVLIWPTARPVRAQGIVGLERETVVRAPTAGELELLSPAETSRVAANQPVARINREDLADARREASAELGLARAERRVSVAEDPGAVRQAEARVRLSEARLDEAARRLDELTLAAPHSGRLIDLRRSPNGQYVADGEPIFRVVDGACRVRVAMSAVDVGDCDPNQGAAVRLRLARDPDRLLTGRVVRVVPSALRAIEDPRQTEAGGGRVVLDPSTGEASESHLLVEIELNNTSSGDLPWGARAAVTFAGQRRSLGGHLVRRIQRFMNRLNVES